MACAVSTGEAQPQAAAATRAAFQRRALWLVAAIPAALSVVPLLYLALRAGQGDGLFGLTGKTVVLLIGRSLLLAGLVSVTSVAIAVFVGALVTVTDLPARRFFAALAVAPLAVPCYVGAATWLAALSPRGPVGGALSLLGLGRVDLSGLFGAWWVLTLFTYPLALLPVMATMRRVDKSPYEAARMLGRGPVRAALAGLWPQVRPSATAGGTLVALYALGEFGAVSLLRYDSFPRVIYIQFLSAFDRSQAAASSLLLVGCVLVVVLIAERVTPKVATQVRTVPLSFQLGAARWPAAVAMGALGVASLGVPLLSLMWWLAAHPWTRMSWLGGAVGVSLGLGLGAAIACALLALAPAWVSVRRTSPAARWLVRISDVSFALPGIVVALGLSFLALRTLPSLYQSWAMVLVAYVVLFAALAVRSLRAVLQRIPEALEEAARTLGRTPARAFVDVTLPLLRPGLASGAVLVVLSAMKELPATMLLIPAGHATLATRLWSYTDEGMYAEAALPALLLVRIGGAAMWVRAPRRAAGDQQ